MEKKLKKKIWIISTIVLLVYVTALVLNPTAWTALLPIIIPSGILTLAPPTYSITKLIKDTLDNKPNKDMINNIVHNQEKQNHLEKEIQPEIKKDNTTIIISEMDYEQETIQEKNKVKTKGTIH